MLSIMPFLKICSVRKNIYFFNFAGLFFFGGGVGASLKRTYQIIALLAFDDSQLKHKVHYLDIKPQIILQNQL